jgi:hypothetical protein
LWPAAQQRWWTSIEASGNIRRDFAPEDAHLREILHSNSRFNLNSFLGKKRGSLKRTSRQAKTFSGRISSKVLFDGLSLPDLGSLLVALDPSRLFTAMGELNPERIATRLGGGKPLGLGSVKPSITLTRWDSNRYFVSSDQAQAEQKTSDELIDEAVKAFYQENRARLMPQWEALGHVLDLFKVDPDLVGYPPGLDRDHFNNPDYWDKGYQFFSQTNGAHGHPIYPLPNVTEDDQTLPIKPQ